MLVERNYVTGGRVISELIDGHLVTKTYVGYSHEEAIENFKREFHKEGKESAGGDFIDCPNCANTSDISSLIGAHTNQCPVCNNPIMPSTFGEALPGTVFVDLEFKGKWCKFTDRDAVCVEDDSGYLTGENATFSPTDIIFPY